MKFELNRLQSYSDEEIIKELQRVAELLNISPLTGAAFEKESKVSRGTINKRFGGWKEALEAAGLGHLYSGATITKNMREQKNRNITDEELLNELQSIATTVGRKDISCQDITQNSAINRDTFTRRFGSLEKAIKLAGLETRKPGAARTIHTEENLFSNLYETWMHYGRQPHYSEMNELPSKIKSKNYINRFGTWRKALIAFIEYADKDDDDRVKDVLELSPIPQPEKTQKTPESRREISLGLRFKVMYRDHFKCVLCGNNPPASPGLILHVDHILPWSKGGKTEIDNLRTLCSGCNIGRSNKYTD
jgi:hypothetical protein